MAKGLDPQVVDIPFLLPNQTPPKHAGPLGRLTSMVDAQIKHFLPSSQQQPQKIEVIPRDGFTALTAACRDAIAGTPIITPDWNNPELLSALGNQLLSVCDSIPRVNNGAAWTYYGNQRVVTNRLSDDVLHTTNHVLTAPDSAYLGGVTCSVWTELSHIGPIALSTAMVGFRGDDGAWVRMPSQLYQNNAGPALARVVTDGTYFWVAFAVGAHIVVNVYDTNGVLIAFDQTSIPQRWTTMPAYWDLGAFNNAGSHYVAVVQPHAYTAVGADVTIDVSKCTVAGAVITVATTNNAVVLCNGPVAFGSNDLNSNPYIITTSNGNKLNGYTLVHNTFVISQAYPFGAVLAGSGVPDSLAGWVDAVATAHAAYSLLSNFSPPAGPANDPGLRYTRSYACTNAAVVTLTNHVNGVLLSSRAFKLDQDWYAATYYQSGGGTNTVAPISITPANPTDYFTGAPEQPVTVQANDFITGAANVAVGGGYVVPTQTIGAIGHTGGDQVVASSLTWTFLVGLFAGTGTSMFDGSSTAPSAAGAILHVAGAANAQNNGDWLVTGVISNTTVQTEPVSLQGNTMVNEAFGGGVTASLTQVWPVLLPQNPQFGFGNTLYPDALMSQFFVNGTAAIAGAAGVNAPINGTYVILRYYTGATWRGFKQPFFAADPQASLFLLTKSSGAGGVAAGNPYYMASPVTFTITPALANAWALVGLNGTNARHDTRAGVPINLVVTGAHTPGNNGTFLETANPMPGSPYGRFVDIAGSNDQRAELFLGFGPSLPTAVRTLVDPTQAYLWHIAGTTFDASYLGATLVLSGSVRPENEAATYTVLSLVPGDPHAVIARPDSSTATNQTLLNFTGFETIKITKTATAGQPAYQPCWYLTPLSVAQNVVGRFEWAIAYADWRTDGAFNLANFNANNYPLALSSVVAGAAGLQFALPYRAQSFTAGQTITNSIGGVIGVQSTAESTIGLKLFTLASSPGLAVANSGEMLLPGPQASEFSASGFTEHGINLGPERPFATTSTVAGLGITMGSSPQYVAVFEVTDENGDRTWSVTSPPLDVPLTGTNNSVTLGGRLPGPTLRVAGIAIYRTANIGTQTIQHYKVTDDLDVNGKNFTFTSVNGGGVNDTWQYVDSSVDKNLLSGQTLLTDQGFLQRFPAPAYRQGVGSWQNRSWVIGYDGAIWMSGEKDEGDSVWFHPAFRYVLPTDDKPVALASMENYLLVFCARSIWYIPAVQFPDATGANGILPTPQPLPFTHGCTGFALTVKAGVAYSSTAGGVWLIDRSLQNIYLSQPMQDDLAALSIAGMTIDGQQRLVVITNSSAVFVYDQISQAWLKWFMAAGAPKTLTTWQSNAVYEDSARVRGQVPGSYADIADGVATGVAPSTAMTLVLGPVKALKRVWAINITGTALGPCQIWFQLQYPDETSQPPTTFGPFALTAGVLNLEINPILEETTTFDLIIFGTFVAVPTPGASYTLELITAECGIEPTLSKRPNAQRLPGG